MRFINRLMPYRKAVVIGYSIVITGGAILLLSVIGKDVLPKVNSSQFQLRLRAPDGTRVERTEEKVLLALKELEAIVGKEHIGITSAYVGQHPSLYSVNPIYLLHGQPTRSRTQVSLKDYHADMDQFKEKMRDRLQRLLPDVKLSFEPIKLTDKVLSQGSLLPLKYVLLVKAKN